MDHTGIIRTVEENKTELFELADRMYREPELAYNELKACLWFCEALEKHGFSVERGLYGMPTSIRAVWGKGHPVIGLLAEYDALPGLSQAQDGKFHPVEAGAPGHGCGHNLLGTATLGAALAIKEDLERCGLAGTVVFYGCPAEEVLTGKAFMARGGAFRDLDLALGYHPGGCAGVWLGKSAGLNSAVFHFKGKTSHAGANPWDGRSALDAAEIMSVGANYLREHIEDGVRIHYAYRETGSAPNVVPDRASVLYYVRAFDRKTVESTYRRLVKCAEGAAHMTETELEVEFLGGCCDTMANSVIAKVLNDKLNEIPLPAYTEEELKLADELNKNSGLYQGREVPPITTKNVGIDVSRSSASTDVGDVMHIVPCTTFSTATQNTLCGGHTWMITCCSGSSFGMKGMLQGAEVMAAAAGEFYRDPRLVAEAQAEFRAAMAGEEYRCPCTPDMPVPQPGGSR